MLKRVLESTSETRSSDEDKSECEDDEDDEKPLRQSRPLIPPSVPEHRTSNYKGVTWHKAAGKWIGTACDVMAERSTTAKTKAPKRITTTVFEDEEECYRAVEALEADINARNGKLWSTQASEDPLTMNVERGPDDIKDAVRGQAYWVPTKINNHRPKRMVVVIKKADKQHGMVWTLCCQHVDPSTGMGSCSNKALASKPNEPKLFCMTHGGKCPCGGNYYACRACLNPLNGEKKLSARMCKVCNFNIVSGKRRLGQGGNGMCVTCDPDTFTKLQSKGEFVSREQFVAIIDELYFPELLVESIGGAVCDATIGSGESRRRADRCNHLMDPDLKMEFMLLAETDELPHQKGKKCYDRDGILGKFSGHMSDIGAPSFSADDAAYIESNALTAEEANGSVQNAKTRNVARVINKMLTAQQAQMIPFRVLSFGVDQYTDSTGKKHPSAFIEYRNDKGEKRIRVHEEEWEHRVECFVCEKKKLLAMGASGQSVVHVRLFYNGSDRLTGLDLPTATTTRGCPRTREPPC